MKINLRLLLAAFSLLSTSAFALQVIEPVEGVNLFVKISAKEQTRLAVENGKILSLIATEGELTAEKDTERGQIFIRPVRLDKPINIRVIPASGKTYSLVMQPVDIPQEDILIRDSAAPKDRNKEAVIVSRNTEFNTAIKSLILAMTTEESVTGIERTEANQELALWEGTRFIKRSVFKDSFLIGDKYELHNVGKEAIRLVEQEFYFKGVVAVAVSSLLLAPGGYTEVFIVREGVK